MHEKFVQGQNGVGPLVSSLERRAAVVLVTNCSSTARRVPPFGLHTISLVRASEETSRTAILVPRRSRTTGHALGAPLRPGSVLPRPASSAPPPRRPASPRRAPPRSFSSVGCPVFGFDRCGLHMVSFPRASEETSRITLRSNRSPLPCPIPAQSSPVSPIPPRSVLVRLARPRPATVGLVLLHPLLVDCPVFGFDII